MATFPFSAAAGSTAYADQAPALDRGLTGLAGITSLYSSIAARNTARCDIAVIGDSIFSGHGATSFAAGPCQQANRAVRGKYPTSANTVGLNAGGLGYIPFASYAATTFTWPVTFTGSAPAAADLGPTRNAQTLTAAGSYTWTAPAGTTSVRVMWFDAAYTGTFSVQVGAGTAVDYSLGGTFRDKTTPLIPIAAGQVLTVAYVSGTVVLDGIIHYNGDEASGITFHQCANIGWNASAIAPYGWNAPENSGYNLDWAQAYLAFDNLCAIGIELMANDVNTSTAAQYQANMQALINTVRNDSYLAALNLPLILFTTWDGTGYDTPVSPWAQYVGAVRALAAANANTYVIDMWYRMPTWAQNPLYPGGHVYNTSGALAHPTNLGAALYGEITAAALAVA